MTSNSKESTPHIHPTAIIEEGATLAGDVTVGPYSYIGGNVNIDSGTTIGSHTRIEGATTIGKNNRIFSHAVLGSIPQDLKYKGEHTELIIGNNNTIREFTLFNPGTEGGGGITKIGDNNLFMGYVHLGHDVQIADNCILANAATLAGHVELGNNVVIGGMTPIHQFVHIGEYAMVAGASALTQDIPPYCLAQGNHAKIKSLNLNGLRRNISREEIDALKHAYSELFKQGKSLQTVATSLLKSTHSNKVKTLCEFIKNSKRGIPFERS